MFSSLIPNQFGKKNFDKKKIKSIKHKKYLKLNSLNRKENKVIRIRCTALNMKKVVD